MKPSPLPRLAIVAASLATPASAQSLRNPTNSSARRSSRSSNSKSSRVRRRAKYSQAVEQGVQGDLDLQTAVKAKDDCEYPGQSGCRAGRRDDQGRPLLIAQLQLQAAIAANDNAAISSAVDAMSASGYLDGAKAGELYVSARRDLL